MPGTTPLYQLPHLIGTDGGKQIAATSLALAQRLEAILRQKGEVPLDSDLASLLLRISNIETERKTVRNAAFVASRPNISDIGTVFTVGALTRQAAGSSGDSFVAAGDSAFTLKEPGVYAATWNVQMKAVSGSAVTPATGRTFVEMVPSAGPATRLTIGIQEDQATLTTPNIIVGATPVTVSLAAFKITGTATTLNSVLNITKVI